MPARHEPGAALWASAPRATIVGHDNIRQRLRDGSATEAAAMPAITFPDSVTFHLNGLEAGKSEEQVLAGNPRRRTTPSGAGTSSPPRT